MNIAGKVAAELDYADHVAALAVNDSDLAQQVAVFHGIEDFLSWMQHRQLLGAKVDMVGQDEFNYDFLIELQPRGRWLGFGVT